MDEKSYKASCMHFIGLLRSEDFKTLIVKAKEEVLRRNSKSGRELVVISEATAGGVDDDEEEEEAVDEKEEARLLDHHIGIASMVVAERAQTQQ